MVSQLLSFGCLPVTSEPDGTPLPNPPLKKICTRAILWRDPEWMARGTVMFCCKIEPAVVSTWSPRPVWLWYHVEQGGPGRIGPSDDSSFFQVPEFFFRDLEFFQIEASCLCKDRSSGGLNGGKHAMFRIRGSRSVANNGGKGGKECADCRRHVTE